ncbi:RNA-binding S4 domain-containing protein [Kumtagia ephedrae]|uniref:RNA-binding protein n=1 Tax=Kumtagia ephedrae TaxID=2116701 RepID=A0A2P7S420_9HYPH|nr:RNA-binding S4 domain-containing protein [Mesorhizobium ephedrae]PSJ57208.1 RNA-binding protein [Mesorhizobium ephedrae]
MAEARQRVDKWLFFARVVKSRSLAAKLAQAGRVRINGEKTDQAADTVRPGDTLTITLERRILVYRVLAPGTRRGPAEEARLLYEDLSPPPTDNRNALPDAVPPVRALGSGRPTKRERRQTDRLRES